MSNAAMLRGFALYQPPDLSFNQRVLAMPVGARAMRFIRMDNGWRLWLATRDFIYGNYLDLRDDGCVLNITARRNEGDEVFVARPNDDHIRKQSHG